jgi:hypothetical protein
MSIFQQALPPAGFQDDLLICYLQTTFLLCSTGNRQNPSLPFSRSLEHVATTASNAKKPTAGYRFEPST